MLSARERITKAIFWIQTQQPFFAYILLHFKFIEKPEVVTMAVDKNGNLFYNPEFVDAIGDTEQIAVILHETCHVAFEHLTRIGGRDPMVWNYATDLVINNILENEGITLPRKFSIKKQELECIVPSNNKIELFGIKIKDINTKTAEIVYDELISKAKKIKYKGFDIHMYGEGKGKDGEDSKEDGDGVPKQGMNGPGIDWKQITVEAATYAKNIGKLSAGIARLVDGLLESKINWRSKLNKYISSILPSDYRFSYPARHSIATGIYMPSIVKENVEVTVAIDTSGSIGEEELKEFLTECVSISKSYDNLIMNVIVCDCDVQESYTLRNGKVKHFLEMKMSGGGGTSHIPVFKYMKEKYKENKLLICFTDGFSDLEEIKFDEYPFNTLVVINSKGTVDWYKNQNKCEMVKID